jgi:hypothetical protein
MRRDSGSNDALKMGLEILKKKGLLRQHIDWSMRRRGGIRFPAAIISNVSLPRSLSTGSGLVSVAGIHVWWRYSTFWFSRSGKRSHCSVETYHGARFRLHFAIALSTEFSLKCIGSWSNGPWPCACIGGSRESALRGSSGSLARIVVREPGIHSWSRNSAQPAGPVNGCLSPFT